MHTRRSTIWLFVLSAIITLEAFPTSAAGAELNVDLELILAVDVSDSMSRQELQLQREGYVSTFRDPRVARAIASGKLGRIAVLYLEWAGPDHHHIVGSWTVLATPGDTAAFANVLAAEPIATGSFLSSGAMSFGKSLDQAPITTATATSISASLLFALEMFRDRRFRGNRQVIDVSGNGTNNSGPPLAPARDLLVSEGIIINGLPLAWPSADNADSMIFLGKSSLERYYKDFVIGGAGAFSIAVSDTSRFREAVRLKILTEIAERETLARPASFEPEPGTFVDRTVRRTVRRMP